MTDLLQLLKQLYYKQWECTINVMSVTYVVE